jgi:hypothetical protein
MRSRAVAAAAAHSTRVGNCTREVYQSGRKIFFTRAVRSVMEWSKRGNLTQKDRKRHRQSDNFRPQTKAGSLAEQESKAFKCGKTRSFLTESAFWGEALKGRSEGSWRSGRRRSGGCRRRGHGQRFVYSVSCRSSFEHTLCHGRATFCLERVKDDRESRRSGRWCEF